MKTVLSQDEIIHCSKADGPSSDEKQEFTEGAAAFFNAQEQATPINENDPFADLEPDQGLSEIVVYED